MLPGSAASLPALLILILILCLTHFLTRVSCRHAMGDGLHAIYAALVTVGMQPHIDGRILLGDGIRSIASTRE